MPPPAPPLIIFRSSLIISALKEHPARSTHRPLLFFPSRLFSPFFQSRWKLNIFNKIDFPLGLILELHHFPKHHYLPFISILAGIRGIKSRLNAFQLKPVQRSLFQAKRGNSHRRKFKRMQFLPGFKLNRIGLCVCKFNPYVAAKNEWSGLSRRV